MTSANRRGYRPFIPECNKRGIGKNTAYNLATDGLLETFLIGRKRYIYLDSLETLGERLALARLEAAGIATPGCKAVHR